MPAPPKNKLPESDASEKSDERRAWQDEQKKHDYYYDDAHGYEVYDPDANDEPDPSPALWRPR